MRPETGVRDVIIIGSGCAAALDSERYIASLMDEDASQKRIASVG